MTFLHVNLSIIQSGQRVFPQINNNSFEYPIALLFYNQIHCWNVILLIYKMGNCSPERRFQQSVFQKNDSSFIEDSLQLLRKNGKLSPVMIQQQSMIASKLKALYLKNKKGGSLDIGNNQFFSYLKNSIFFLGTMSQNKYQGESCIAVFPGDKIFSGAFKNGQVRGHGFLQFKVRNTNNNVKFTGKWDDRICGHIEINESRNKRYLEVNRQIANKKNIKFIEYSNFDTYLGETQNELAHGYGKYVFRSGNTQQQYPYYEGMYVKGIRHGQGQMHYNDNFSLKINWENGKPEGAGTLNIGFHCQPVYFQNGQRVLSRASLFKSKISNENPEMSYF